MDVDYGELSARHWTTKFGRDGRAVARDTEAYADWREARG